MRQLLPILGAWLLLMSVANISEAQAPAPLPVADYSIPVGDNNGAALFQPPPAAMPYEPPCTVDLIVGFPTGVRVQYELGGEIGRNWLLEGFAGVELIFPMVGGGVRRRITLARGQRDAFSINPGVDAYVLYNTLHDGDGWFSGGPTTAGLITADVDFFWQHAMNDRLTSHLGVKLGAGAAFGVREVTVPVFGVAFGFSF